MISTFFYLLIELCLKVMRRQRRYYEENYLRYKFNKLGIETPKSLVFYGEPIFRLNNPKSIKFGENIVLCSDPFKNDIGVNHPVILTCTTNEARIEIGDNTGISGASIAAIKKVTIGRNCLIGANVIITDNDFHPIRPMNRRYSKENVGSKEVTIKDNVFIGANSIILKGVTVGENSVIAAGSIVTKDIDENSIYGGNPCRKIKEI
ncbi:MAG: acyltransferase [Bacteriovoracaceae bacterium]|nr:acyltransferase [Bacteriovoracaceae bacterium]